MAFLHIRYNSEQDLVSYADYFDTPIVKKAPYSPRAMEESLGDTIVLLTDDLVVVGKAINNATSLAANDDLCHDVIADSSARFIEESSLDFGEASPVSVVDYHASDGDLSEPELSVMSISDDVAADGISDHLAVQGISADLAVVALEQVVSPSP